MDITKLNVFIFCKWMRHLGRTLMLTLVSGIIALATFSTLSSALIPGMKSDNIATQAGYILLTLIYITVIVMVFFSYIATMITDPGGVPPGWHPFNISTLHDDIEAGNTGASTLPDLTFLHDSTMAERLTLYFQLPGSMPHSGPGYDAEERARAVLERPRWCRKCKAWKPPRSHHCSMTRRCVLKMDHYCVWVSNTVGLLNYKQFVLFLWWAGIGCVMSSGLLLRPCISFFSTSHADVRPLVTAFIAFVFTAAFALALLAFMVMHGRLVAINQTTIEAYEKRPVKPWPYDKGSALRNFYEVFGSKASLWLVPIIPRHHQQQLLAQTLDSVAVPLPGGDWEAEIDTGSGIGGTSAAAVSSSSSHLMTQPPPSLAPSQQSQARGGGPGGPRGEDGAGQGPPSNASFGSEVEIGTVLLERPS